MDRHPIESLMGTSMENIGDMIDVNTVIGDPVQTQDGSTVIPVSRVSFGFIAGGGEYAAGGECAPSGELPFAGGASAGVSVQPVGFLVCSDNGVRLLRASCASPFERLAEIIPQVMDSLKGGDEEKRETKDVPRVRAVYQE